MGRGSEDTGKELCPMMGRMPVRGISEEDLPDLQSRGGRLYANYCSQCHALPSPKAHSAREWEKSFRRMDARMQMMKMCRMMNIEAPNEEEKQIILAYLQKHALKVIEKGDLPASESAVDLRIKAA